MVIKRKTSPSSSWSFREHGVSQSFLGCFLKCREEARLRFQEMWTPKNPAEALEFGSACHHALSRMYLQKAAPTAKQIQGWIKEYEAIWKSTFPTAGAALIADKERYFGKAELLLEAYTRCWAGDWGGKPVLLTGKLARPKRWLELERPFMVPYKLKDGTQTFLRGCFDGVFEDEKGGIWLFETKTKGWVDPEGIQAMLPADLQVLFYLSVMRILWPANKVRGVLYNVLRVPGQRFNKGEPLKEYLERVREDLKPSRFDHYFVRIPMEITTQETASFQQDTLQPMLTDVAAWVEGKAPHYHNPTALDGRWGRSDFFDAIVNDDFSGLYRRKLVFPELDTKEVRTCV